MSTDADASGSVHGSAVVVGGTGILIRGPSGAGKSTLARELIQLGTLFGHSTVLVADDRVALRNGFGAVVASAVPPLGGLLEVRGLGIARVPFLDEAAIGLVVDVQDSPPPRLPEPEERRTMLCGLELPRIVVYGPGNALVVLWRLSTGDDAFMTSN